MSLIHAEKKIGIFYHSFLYVLHFKRCTILIRHHLYRRQQNMWKRTLNTSKPFSTSTTKLAKIQSPNSVSHRNTPILNSLFQSSASYSSSPPFVREIEELYPTAGGLYFGGSRFHKENVNLFVRKKNSFCSESQSAKKLHCWSCGATADGTTLFLVCQACRSVQPVNHSIDYYQILGV